MGTKVRDVMTPGPIGVGYDQTIGDAARAMRDWGIGAVLVVADQALYGPGHRPRPGRQGGGGS
jgi:CBS domain-containing protein